MISGNPSWSTSAIAVPLRVSVETDIGTVTGIEHGGGDKIHDEVGETDPTLDDFVDWIAYYVECLE